MSLKETSYLRTDYARLLNARTAIDTDSILLVPASGPPERSLISEFSKDLLNTTILAGAATAPTNIGTGISTVAGYPTAVQSQGAVDAGILIDGVLGDITIGPDPLVCRLYATVLLTGLTSKDKELRLLLRSSIDGDRVISSVGVTNNQNSATPLSVFVASFAAGEVLSLGLEYDVNETIVIVGSSFELEVIA